jgi:hypothetical protein
VIEHAVRSGTFVPTLAEHHLLRASLLGDRNAVRESLAQWKSRVHLDDVEYGSFRLLPLFYRNLQRHGIDDDAMPRLKGIYRNAWVRNQLLVEHGLRALRTLREHDIDSIVLKGAALVADRSYAELALRPMEDFDLLVRPHAFRRAIDVLRASGWAFHPTSVDPEWYLPFRHAVALRNGNAELDLHWTSIRDRFDGEESFWEDAIDAKLMGENVRVLSPVDQLVQLCGHASARNVDVAPIRWVADAWFLLTQQGLAFDWTRLVEVARQRELSFPMRRCLEYLDLGLGVAVPHGVILELEHHSSIVSRVSLKLRNSYGPAIYIYVIALWLRFACARPRRQTPHRLRLLPRYVRFYFRLESDASLLRFAARKLLVRVRPPRLTRRAPAAPQSSTTS